MSHSQSRTDATLRGLLDAAVRKYATSRRTFTEEEALADIWAAGYDASPEDEPRFVLAREADGRAPRHWCLKEHVVAGNRLIQALESESWDGHDLEAELLRLDREHGGHHVFCQADERLTVHPDGRVKLADDDRDLVLPEDVLSSLGALADGLLERWRAVGSAPWTVRQATECLSDLGWERAKVRGAWLQVRAWLRGWAAVVRVGRDYWAPAEAIPAGPARTRMSVIRMGDLAPGDGTEHAAEANGADGQARPLKDVPADSTTVAVGASTRWVAALRTVNLLEGFLAVPAGARAAYPPAPKGGGRWEVVRGLWFETGERLWVWLDREQNVLCGPDLAERLAWREAGERFEIAWTADALVFRSTGVDAEVQREETRLADAETLASLRGGLGEPYRRSIVAVLTDRPSGLPFRELLTAVRERQGHEVHRSTLRAVLHAGGFLCKDGRWRVGPDDGRSRRQLREAIVRAGGDRVEDEDQVRSVRARLVELASAVRSRCRELRRELRSDRSEPSDELG